MFVLGMRFYLLVAIQFIINLIINIEEIGNVKYYNIKYYNII